MKAVRKHTDNPWVITYIERWLKAPMQMPDGTLVERDRGTPQGSLCEASHNPPYAKKVIMRSRAWYTFYFQ
jgi:hypothetical protein